MWKGVIGVEVVVATAFVLPLVKELQVLVVNEELVAVVGLVEQLVLDVAVVVVAVVVVEIGACVLAGEGRMGRP